MVIHVDLDTVVEVLQKRGFSRGIAERARAAPDDQRKITCG
jgi:hypothetical protein